ncbi:MAG: prenyltransferase/squalene oxidase repeat-containing protein [Candidatus Atabeyarchaeum deiterrae]
MAGSGTKRTAEVDLEEWLLTGEPWVAYRVLKDVIGKSDDDRTVAAALAAVSDHPHVRLIFRKMNKDGYWGKPKDIHTWWPRKDTTFWLLPVLADFGFTVGDERIAKACEYVFSTQLDSGGFGWDPPSKPGDCHSAIIVEALAKLGLLEDLRLKNAYDYLIRRQRIDGGYWCKDTGQVGAPREGEPSCAFATIFALGALAQNPNLRNSEMAKKSVDFLFQCWTNRGKVKYAGHDSGIEKDWEKLKYPFTDYKILKFMDVLSQFDYARKRLKESEMLDLLLRKQDEQGRFTPESIIKMWSNFDFGQKERPSRWITLLALRIAKRIL